MLLKVLPFGITSELDQVELNNQHSNAANYTHRKRPHIAISEAVAIVDITAEKDGCDSSRTKNVEVYKNVAFEVFHLSTEKKLIEACLGPHDGHFD